LKPHFICGLRQWARGMSLSLLLLGIVALPSSAQDGGRKLKTGSQPEYPQLARQFKITGTTRLELLVSAEGKVKNVKVLGGSPVLVRASVDAVNKWVYEPAAKDSTILVKFDFTGEQ